MLDRALVEAVDLELEPVVVEVDEQMALERTRGRVGEVTPSKIGMDGKAAEAREPAALVRLIESHHARSAPLPVLLDLDQEAAAFPGLGERQLDLVQKLVPAGPDRAEEGI